MHDREDGSVDEQSGKHEPGSLDTRQLLRNPVPTSAVGLHITHTSLDAVMQLCDEQLRPVAAEHAGGCPGALVARFYDEACAELARVIRASGQVEQPEPEWSNRGSAIQRQLAGKLRNSEREWHLLTLAKAGSVAAEDTLLAMYRAPIERLAKSFYKSCSAIIDDLFQEGLIAFRAVVIEKYDPHTAVTLAEFTHLVLRRKMGSICSRWAKLAPSEHLQKQVTQAADRLRQKHPAYEPTAEEIALECGASMTGVRLALKKSFVTGLTSLEKDREEEELSSTRAVDPLADPAIIVEERARQEPVVRFLNEWSERGSDGQDGTRWLAIFILKEYERYDWGEILAILQEQASVDWLTLHEVYAAPYTVPTDWGQICHLFGPGRVKLTESNLRKWYDRRTKELERGFDRRELT